MTLPKSHTALLALLPLFASAECKPCWPPSGVFLGLGGSYNSVKIDQTLYGAASTDVYLGAVLEALGIAGGTANPYHETQSTLAPEVQLCYNYHVSNSNWLFGIKSFYQYLGLTFTENNIDSFQNGAFTIEGGAGNTFTGHFLISSSQTSVYHEIAALPYCGYSWGEWHGYLGAGAVVFGTTHNLYGVAAFADINGAPSNITGAPTDFFQSKWMWGGLAQIGLSYALTATWLLDFNYSYAVTPNYTMDKTTTFSNTLYAGGSTYNETGSALITIVQGVTAQSFSYSINKIF